jgi:hypothetical protein
VHCVCVSGNLVLKVGYTNWTRRTKDGDHFQRLDTHTNSVRSA